MTFFPKWHGEGNQRLTVDRKFRIANHFSLDRQTRLKKNKAWKIVEQFNASEYEILRIHTLRRSITLAINSIAP